MLSELLYIAVCVAAELNGYSETVSKRSIPIQPQVVAVPEGEADRYSEFSHHSRGHRPSSRGFQL